MCSSKLKFSFDLVNPFLNSDKSDVSSSERFRAGYIILNPLSKIKFRRLGEIAGGGGTVSSEVNSDSYLKISQL